MAGRQKCIDIRITYDRSIVHKSLMVALDRFDLRTRILHRPEAFRGALDYPDTTGNFSLCRAAMVCVSSLRCASTNSRGVSASH